MASVARRDWLVSGTLAAGTSAYVSEALCLPKSFARGRSHEQQALMRLCCNIWRWTLPSRLPARPIVAFPPRLPHGSRTLPHGVFPSYPIAFRLVFHSLSGEAPRSRDERSTAIFPSHSEEDRKGTRTRTEAREGLHCRAPPEQCRCLAGTAVSDSSNARRAAGCLGMH